MRAILQDNQWVYFDNITESEEDILWVELSASKPNQYIDTSNTLWDGVYRKYNRTQKRIARPLLGLLMKICQKFNLPLEIADFRPDWPYPVMHPDEIDNKLLPGITLDDHQVRAIRKAAVSECGIINLPTGGGKTEVMSGICRIIDCPTIIIAEQKVVIDQIKERLELRQVAEEVGLFYAGHKPTGQTIVVGSIQSLNAPTKTPLRPDRRDSDSDKAYAKRLEKWETSMKAFKTRRKNAKYLQEYVKKAEMILVDECDLATSDHYKKVFRHWFTGRRRYGFSGTPTDPSKPVEALVMQEHLGSIIAQETRQHLVSIGRIISCDYTMIGIGPFDQITEASTFDIAKEEHMVENDSFHRLIAQICKKYKGDGTLILVDREHLGQHLLNALSAVGLTSEFLYGKTPKKQRDRMLKAFEDRQIDVLIGGKLVNRGLDLAGGCENLIIASGGKLQSDFEQKIGRALRINKRGKSRVFDFFFRCNKHLYGHSKARLQTMVNNGYETRVIFPGGTISGEELISKRWRVPPKYLKKKT